jgi:hypothetical protein
MSRAPGVCSLPPSKPARDASFISARRPPLGKDRSDILEAKAIRTEAGVSAQYAAAFQLHPQSSLQALPQIPSIPSLAMIGTITSPAIGSAHHQPSTALRSKPPSRIADK